MNNKMFEEINGLVKKSFPHINCELHHTNEKTITYSNRFRELSKDVDWVFEFELNNMCGLLTVHTWIDSYGKMSFSSYSCEYFEEELKIQKYSDMNWGETTNFIENYFQDKDLLKEQNTIYPIVFNCMNTVDEIMDSYERNQVLLWTVFGGLDYDEEERPELSKLYEHFHNYTEKLKSVSTDVEPSFIDESDMLVSYMKEQIRNGNFEEWVGKQ